MRLKKNEKKNTELSNVDITNFWRKNSTLFEINKIIVLNFSFLQGFTSVEIVVLPMKALEAIINYGTPFANISLLLSLR